MDGVPSDADLTAHATGAHRVTPPRSATGAVPKATFGWWLVTYRDGSDDVIEAQLLNAEAHWSPEHGPCGFVGGIKRAIPLTADGRPAHVARDEPNRRGWKAHALAAEAELARSRVEAEARVTAEVMTANAALGRASAATAAMVNARREAAADMRAAVLAAVEAAKKAAEEDAREMDAVCELMATVRSEGIAAAMEDLQRAIADIPLFGGAARTQPAAALADDLVAAEQIREGDAVAVRADGTAVAVPRRPRPMFEGVDISTVLCPPDDGRMVLGVTPVVTSGTAILRVGGEEMAVDIGLLQSLGAEAFRDGIVTLMPWEFAHWRRAHDLAGVVSMESLRATAWEGRAR